MVWQMATYREILERVRQQNGFTVKTCWIAHVMSDLNLTRRQAVNRINGMMQTYPRPDDKRPAIVSALRHFRML
jgi:hypothetical protein